MSAASASASPVSSTLRFPDETVIQLYLSLHPALKKNTDTHFVRVINQAISIIAAARFTEKEKTEEEIKKETVKLIYDLQTGKAVVNGQSFTEVKGIVLNFSWFEKTSATEKALLDCAKKIPLGSFQNIVL